MRGLLRFVHLSDIHFSKREAGSVHELDEVVRHELRLDVVDLVGKLGGASAIVVSGDIAFSGSKQEYEKAAGFLRELTNELGLPPEAVWLVPGNHDVDWTAFKDRALHRQVRDSLRRLDGNELDQQLEALLTDEEGRDALFGALENFNDFAARYGCVSTPAKPAWKSDLAINSNYVLRMVGVNSALVSSRDDDVDNKKLVVGSMQTGILRSAGVVHMAICHHPFDWLSDGVRVQKELAARAPIQLTGHIHEFSIHSGDPSHVRVAAGAMHPERGSEPYEPRYNIIELDVDDSKDGPAQLAIKIWPRAWTGTAFGHPIEADEHVALDETGRASYIVELDDVVTQVKETQAGDTETDIQPLNVASEEYEVAANNPSTEGIVNRARRLQYRLSLLNSGARRSVAENIGLAPRDLARLSPREVVQTILEFARRVGAEEALWDAIYAETEGRAAGKKTDDANPYRSRDD